MSNSSDAHYAVIVGINRYPGLKDLHWARADAEAFHEWIVAEDGGGVPATNARLITTTEEEDRTFVDIDLARPRIHEIHRALWDINEDLKKRVNQDPSVWNRSRLYVYLSGHGLVPRGAQVALLMANSVVGWLGDNFEMYTYAEHFERCGTFKELVFLADCCRELSGTAPFMSPPFDYCDAQFGQSTKLLGYATAMGALAYEDANADTKRGYFTQALLAGLNGGARSTNGYISAQSLNTYIASAVQALAEADGKQQRATFDGALGTDICFRSRGQSVTRLVSIKFPTDFSGSVKLEDKDLNEVATWIVTDQPWQEQLDEGFYRVSPVDSDWVGSFKDNGFFQVAGGDLNVKL